jgi:hypothetical protein
MFHVKVVPGSAQTHFHLVGDAHVFLDESHCRN